MILWSKKHNTHGSRLFKRPSKHWGSRSYISTYIDRGCKNRFKKYYSLMFSVGIKRNK